MAMGDGDSDRTLTRPMGNLGAVAPERRARLHIVHPAEMRRTVRLLDEDMVLGRRPEPGITLQHNTVSRRHVAIRFDARRAAFSVEELGSRNGSRLQGAALEAGTAKPLNHGDVLRLGNVLSVFERGSGKQGASVLRPGDPQIPGIADATVALREELALAARDPAPVLLTGETGTGKEHAARELHRLSGRRGAFVAVNCAALSAQLVEGQLFGHRRGAFTGADRDSPGLFRSADGGTLLLDEIGELSDAVQAKLLRVVQEAEVLPVGAARAVPVDVRIVAATLRPLQQWVAEGRFRLDLYARLASFEITLAPLRARRADIAQWIETLHAQWYAQRERPATAIDWDADRLESILLHPLADNLRGLARIVHRGASRGVSSYAAEPAVETTSATTSAPAAAGQLAPSHPAPGAAASSETAPAPARARRPRPPRDEILTVLRDHGGSVRALARHYDRDRRQIYRWLDHYDLRSEIGKGHDDQDG